MKKALITLLLACCFPVALLAEVFRDSASNFEIDFPAGWAVEKSNDPAVILRLGRSDAFAEFTKLDSELSDFYLKARVKEQVDSLRSKGNTISGEVKNTGDSKADFVQVVASLYGADGKIVGAANAYLEQSKVDPEGLSAFSVRLMNVSAPPAAYRIQFVGHAR